mgnify:CR=1 FL=1
MKIVKRIIMLLILLAFGVPTFIVAAFLPNNVYVGICMIFLIFYMSFIISYILGKFSRWFDSKIK